MCKNMNEFQSISERLYELEEKKAKKKGWEEEERKEEKMDNRKRGVGKKRGYRKKSVHCNLSDPGHVISYL